MGGDAAEAKVVSASTRTVLLQSLAKNPAEPVDGDTFRQALGRFTSGVVVLTVDVEGSVRGMTVSAFMSGSLSPPLVVASVAKKASLYDAFLGSPAFGISILAEQQEDLSRHFSRDQLLPVQPVTERLGHVPILAGAAAAMAVRTESRCPCGDHTLLIALVTHVRMGMGTPLVYQRGRYRRLHETDDRKSAQ